MRGGAATAIPASSPTEVNVSTPPLSPVEASEESSSAEEEASVAQVEQVDDPKILMLVRLLFVTYYASLGSLLPYLPVYYHSLGHGGQIIGLIGAIKPFTTFLVAPFWGIVSDQTGSPFAVLYFTFLVSLVGQLLVAWKHNPTYIMIMVFITAFFNAPVKSLLDSMVISHLNDRLRYGRLRLWGQLGFGIGSSAVGVLLSKSKHRPYHPHEGHSMLERLDNFWQSLTGYKLLFLTYACLSIPTWVCIRAFHQLHNQKEKEKEKLADEEVAKRGTATAPEKKPEPVGVWSGIKIIFQNSDALLFFFLFFVVGVSSGIIENFAYVRMREVGGTGKEMGISRLVSSMAGAPMFWFSGPLTELLGADRVIVVSLMSYVLRFFIYALMRSPLQGIPAEALRGVTFAAFWSTCTIYASRIAPPGLGATMVRAIDGIMSCFLTQAV
jgi:MFS family permease